ncbi:WD repeat-containing protein on Y chromosome-like isoform X2 [Lethenteron reissneri]|uniref:WD repeat-containing protein on Y chromosome-like isoform X2 n=1 Tax=Lethenteron reissneri TaxID=7753 RepID=UPI002AB71083|nr:WD repeat-containing protein on Y chromosome-like isoform X2 [Lethenteron reissneri]
MNRAEFRQSLRELLGSDRWGEQMDGLFDKVDASGGGYVDWGDFCAYMLMQYRERDFARARHEAPFPPLALVIRHCTHNKQEVCTRLLALDSPAPLRFVSVSKEGVLTVWDRHLRLQRSFQEEVEDPRGGKRRFRTWSTDAVVLPDVHKIAVSTTSRDIRFYDVSTPNFTQEFQLFALNNVPTCMHYSFNEKAPGSPSVLLWGDDSGAVNLLTILQPHAGLFEKPFSREEGVRRIFMQDLGDHARLLKLRVIPGVHEGPVRAIRFVAEGGGGGREGGEDDRGGLLFSCCESAPHLSGGARRGRVAEAVRVEHEQGLPVLRLQPRADAGGGGGRRLPGARVEPVLKVWDLQEHACLQTLCVRFPCVQPGRTLRHGDFPLLLLPPPLHGVLASCADYVALLPLGVPEARGAGIYTHATALSAAAYNPLFRQVVTGGEDSCVIVWDVETGAKWLALNNAHGEEEITSLGFDSSGRRLLTGARNGTVKVWNVQNGHNLLRLQAVGAAEVTGVACLREHKLLTVGWNRKILLYDDSKPDVTALKADSSWKGGQLHREDILALSYSPALGLLATGSYDGAIFVWSAETQKLFLRLGEHGSSRPPRPVDRLLFLQARAAVAGLRDAALLLSSEGGCVHWWQLYGQQQRHLGERGRCGGVAALPALLVGAHPSRGPRRGAAARLGLLRGERLRRPHGQAVDAARRARGNLRAAAALGPEGPSDVRRAARSRRRQPGGRASGGAAGIRSSIVGERRAGDRRARRRARRRTRRRTRRRARRRTLPGESGGGGAGGETSGQDAGVSLAQRDRAAGGTEAEPAERGGTHERGRGGGPAWHGSEREPVGSGAAGAPRSLLGRQHRQDGSLRVSLLPIPSPRHAGGGGRAAAGRLAHDGADAEPRGELPLGGGAPGPAAQEPRVGAGGPGGRGSGPPGAGEHIRAAGPSAEP